MDTDRYVKRKLSTISFENRLFGIGVLLVVEQSSLESQSRGCAKTPLLTVLKISQHQDSLVFLKDLRQDQQNWGDKITKNISFLTSFIEET